MSEAVTVFLQFNYFYIFIIYLKKNINYYEVTLRKKNNN